MDNFTLDIRDYSLTAGATLELHNRADFFQIMEATGDVTVDFLNRAAHVGRAESVGQGFRLEVEEGFTGIKIYSATAQTVKLCFSNGSRADLSQVVSVTGEVSVISGELSRVKNGDAFSAYGYATAAAGEYSFGQLWNPAGSGINVVLTRASVSSNAASPGVVAFFRPTSSLDANGAIYTAGKSKLVGSADSAASIYTGQTPTMPGTTYGQPYASVFVEYAKSVVTDFPEPFVIPPGKGVMVDLTAVNLSADIMFQWFEELI